MVWQLKILLLMLLLSQPIHAKQWYQIELIVFAHNSANTEIFDQTETRIKWPKRLMELSAMEYAKNQLLQTPINYAKFQVESRVLNAEYYQLQRRGGFQPLLHVAWMQAVASNSKGRPVLIFKEGDYLGDLFSVHGYVNLQRGHYLHLKINLEYDVGALVYMLDQRRRLYLNETNYLDHPKFGVIARVELLKAKDPAY